MKPVINTLAISILLILSATFSGEAAEVSSSDLVRIATEELVNDSTLQTIKQEALERLPEIVRAEQLLRADELRVRQAGALPDPVLSLGIQNDGFNGIEIGRMENSYWSTMVSQTFPWFGKRRLRTQTASGQTEASKAAVERIQLTTTAAVERAYVDLLLVRARLELQLRIEDLSHQAEEYARIRYETGQGSQSDFLRAQLQSNRLDQRRWALEAEEQTRLAALNRLRGNDSDDPIPTTLNLIALADPDTLTFHDAIADAEQRSPDLAAATALADAASTEIGLARKDYYPDFTTSAGIMPRGGGFPTMWTLGVSFNLPLWSARKQKPAVAEARARYSAATSEVEAIRRTLQQRATERVALANSLAKSNRLYRSGLITQSDATVTSTLAQFRVGNTSFVSVLESITGYLSDYEGLLQSIAESQRVAIAHREVSLDPVTATSELSFPVIQMPSASGTNSVSGGVESGSASSSKRSGGSSGMSGM